ncbi:beta-glucoside-specific PTS transporter subunit IIABC [Tessaracoccus caeni]|uniref:beta-glucoside-specific PTS transporter subunit IIABC n=1 Tax=Tessaracoccus caeni TaxID=3031239 RepID=UPI0023DC3EFF|nr:beta-glucoside-specific PTS transporter subunit IIABC [Tessaracoccus caeni]MDF1490280.1 beta-glucoside-specific PTS transporter subunit IIABC [Tessaracoccus caeni]
MAEPVRNYPKLALQILEKVGGEKNIVSATRCATRLRLVLRETPAGAKETVGELPGVITVVESGGQFQVVIGAHVGEVHEALMANTNLSADVDNLEAPKQSVVNRLIATMSAVFAPFVYILAGAGLLQGLLILIKMIHEPFEKTDTHAIFSMISWSPFAFLPIFIAITASKHFKSNTFIAVFAAAALVNPDWAAMAARIVNGETVDLFGIALSPTTYTSTVIPPLLMVWALSYMERFLNRYLKGAFQALLVPFISVVVIVPLTLLVIGPLSAAGANGIAAGYNWLVDVAPVVAAAIIGGIWQVAVIFGIHWGITPVVLANFELYRYDSFQAFQTAAVVAQVGAALGVFFKTRNKELKGVAGSAAATGVFGITEPTIYGVTLRLKRPFLLACIAGAAGGIVIALFGARQYAYAGLPGMLTIVNAYSPDNPMSLPGEIIGCAVAFVLAAVLVYVVGFDDPVEKPAAEEVVAEAEEQLEESARESYTAALAAASTTAIVSSPMAGRVLSMASVPDPVFASGAMGNGVAIDPTEGKVYAPFNGKVSMVAKTKHALGLISEDGVELLIHIGIDTVKLDGAPFTVHTAAKTEMKKGDLLVEFDIAAIKAAGYSTVTPIIVTNSKKFGQVLPTPITVAQPGEDLVAAVKLPVAAG